MDNTMDPNDVNTGLIAALVGALASFMTWLGVRRKSTADEVAAVLKGGVDMHQLAMDAASKIREELQQELARAENARREAEALASRMSAQISELEYQLDRYRTGYRKVSRALLDLVGPEGLEELSDLPEDL